MIAVELFILVILGFVITWRITKMPTNADLTAAATANRTAIADAATRVANALANPVSQENIDLLNEATAAANAIAPEV